MGGIKMTGCKACDAVLDAGCDVELCKSCTDKQLSCRVCGTAFTYQVILNDLPIVQCPTCEGRAVDVMES